MTVAQLRPRDDARGSSRWLLLGSLALNLFFVGVAVAMAVRAPAPPPGTATCSCASSAWPPPCRRPTPTCCAARSRPTARRSRTRRPNTAPPRTRSAQTLRQEPFDAAAMRAAMAKTRAARQNFDQVIQGVFAGTAAQMSSAGRHALADWPPGRKSASNQQ